MLGRHIHCSTTSVRSSSSLLRQSQRGFSHAIGLNRQFRTKDQGEDVVRKPPRSLGQNPLRKVAIEAERTRITKQSCNSNHEAVQLSLKKVIAYCVAEQYDMRIASKLLQDQGFLLDPLDTGLYPQVLHVRVPAISARVAQASFKPETIGPADVMLFPSGTIVAWNVAESVALDIVYKVLKPALLNTHYDFEELEKEDLEFIEDGTKIRSEIIGETIVIGTSSSSSAPTDGIASFDTARRSSDNQIKTSETNTILAKIAFSSGMARSTKLAMLERLTEAYIASTRSIPLIMSKGTSFGQRPSLWHKLCRAMGFTPGLPFSRPFILQKTGELLAIRAQLNLYSELTDSLPDLFWDSKHELRLENYYDIIGRVLDVGVRIKILNEKMDYAQEIATTLRETLSERHNLRLEWGIIILIAIEVLFEVERRWTRS